MKRQTMMVCPWDLFKVYNRLCLHYCARNNLMSGKNNGKNYLYFLVVNTVVYMA